MVTIGPTPLQCSGRAHDILKNMREKRESFLVSNPLLQKNQMVKPTPKQKKRGIESASRVKDILTEMKNSRNSLSSLIENHKNSCKFSTRSVGKRSTRSAGKRSTRSEGQSTAITAAETESLLSSCADDNSFCYSDTITEEAPGFQFVIDTEESESDFCSLSTREEVERAVGTIYEKIIPHALSAINLSENKIQSPKSYYSWDFKSENNAGELYRNGGIHHSVAGKKRRRIKNSEKKREMARARIEINEPSHDFVTRSHEQKNKMKSLLDSVSEMKISDETNRRGRKLENSQNSSVDSPADVQRVKAEEQKMRERVAEKKKRRIRAAEKKKKMAKMKKELPSSSVISDDSSPTEIIPSPKHKSLQTEVLVTPKKMQNVSSPKALTTPSVAPSSLKSSTRRPSRLRQYDTSDGSNPILAHSTHSRDKRMIENDSVIAVSKHQHVEYERPALTPIHQNLSRSLINKAEECDGSAGSLLVSPENSDAESLLVTPNRSEDESDVIIFEEPDDAAHVLPVSVPVSIMKSSTSSAKSSGFADKSKKPLASKSDIEYVPRNMKSRNLPSQKRTAQRSEEEKPMYTIEDIMEEMNRLATKNASEGLRIPNGTVLKLRRLDDKRKNIINDEQSCTGWSFTEASEISTLGPIPVDESLVKPSFQKSPTNQSRNSRAYVDITNRFCGGHYHMALMSGMPAGTADLEV